MLFMLRDDELLWELHCARTRVLWELLFSLFRVSWVTPLVWDTLLGWNESFVAKDRRRVWGTGPLCNFCAVWKARSDIVFSDEVLSMQKVKSFLYIFFGWRSKLFGGWSRFCNSLIGWV